MVFCCFDVQVQHAQVPQGYAVNGWQVLADRARQVEEVQQLLQLFKQILAGVGLCCARQQLQGQPFVPAAQHAASAAAGTSIVTRVCVYVCHASALMTSQFVQYTDFVQYNRRV
jgi:hypothetical protein